MPRPILIKAGDKNVRLGCFAEPPLVDCRVVAEDEYQKMMELLTWASGVCDHSEWEESYTAWLES